MTIPPTERGGSVLPRHFIIGVFDAYRLKLTREICYAKKWIRGLKMSFSVNFRFISGEISAEKRFVFEFQGESLRLFLSYLAHFRCYQHF